MTIGKLVFFVFFAVGVAGVAQSRIVLKNGPLTFMAEAQGFRYGFAMGTRSVVSADNAAGLLLAGSPVNVKPVGRCAASRCVLMGANAAGTKVRITVILQPHHAELIAEPAHMGDKVIFVTDGASPAFGLADHAVEQNQFSTLSNKQFNTDVTGFADDAFLSGQGLTRLVSNFVIYPKQGFAELLIDPFTKIVHTSGTQIVQGVQHAGAQVPLHYFFGTPHEIYLEYLRARNAADFKVMIPKYDAFGVGWEAFGALGWDTNAKTVRDSVDRYLAAGYPLKWIVIGSGFWPAAPEMHETTSFGLWDKQKYPDPAALLAHFHGEKLKTMLGLRITFIKAGPYSSEGLKNGYFMMKDGQAQVFKGGWPKMPYYLLDAHNPEALDWYMRLVKKWNDYGVDGYKEDFYGYGGYGLRDDKVDPTNDRLMAEGKIVIERNGYLSSNGDLHRINDFNYNQNQDRGPVNSLALAYAGFPLVYPDIVGGTFGEDRFSSTRTAKMETYMMRNAQWAALHSSMGMGEPPWAFSPKVASVMLASAKLHARFAPYIFSNARKFAKDGYPWTMTPLPIAFPQNENAYGHENATDRGYEWMIGDAMLATPLYGEDYATAETRDVYLPSGQWMDFDSGTIYTGRQTLKGFSLPAGKTPLFLGGSGVTLEEIDGVVRAVVYPVAIDASATMTLPESMQALTVDVRGLPIGTKWRGIRVVDGDNKSVPVAAQGFGFSFVPKSGETYKVQALR
ncbi:MULTISPECIES: TIM-barrel domain-containing protein [Acidobacteriaceae]|uniref:TIM-barrel domain-containing protein n=1 Tax=Acidobacteriaceae TaxID=204434 RepID=UPI00131C5DF5|nr:MULTISPECIES: TIM-barrel domain-containing protein [Acidobacteriaceae]MDW5265511.1 glycoside hydrolase family 31 protein [Edaphobacter sp.]